MAAFLGNVEGENLKSIKTTSDGRKGRSRRVISRAAITTIGLAVAGTVGLGMLSNPAHAGTVYWDADGVATNGANGQNNQGAALDIWDPAAAAKWWSAGTDSVWSNTSFNTAWFGARPDGGTSAGLVTVASGGITVGGLIFDTTSGSGQQYNIGGTGILTLQADAGDLGTPTITVMQASDSGTAPVDTTISAILGGDKGFILAGTGTLLLSNTGNTLTGGITINGGVLKVSNAGNVGANLLTLNNGNGFGGLYITTGFVAANNMTTGANGGVLDVASGQTLTLNGNLSTGAGSFIKNDGGTLLINSDNSTQTFTSGIVVNGGQVKGTVSNGINPFGNTTTLTPVTLNNAASLYGLSNGTTASTTSGTLTVSGGNMLAVDASATAGNTMTMNFGSLARSGTGTLIVNAVRSSLGINEKVAFTTTPTLLNAGTMIAPWAVGTSGTTSANDGFFLNYTGGTLVAATSTVGGTSGNVTGTGTTKLANTVATDIVNVTGTDTSLLAATPQTVFALRTNQNITGTGGTSTLTIGSGGLIFNGTVGIGSATAASAVNVDFGATEGLIFVRDGQTGSINNVIPATSTGGFTKFGNGTLSLGFGAADTTPNAYAGTVTVNGGTLLLNKAANTAAITGNLIIGPGANIASATGAVGIVKLNLSGQIASTSNVTIQNGGVLNLNGQNNTIGSLTFTGSGNVTTGAGILTLNGNITATSGNQSGLNANSVTGSDQNSIGQNPGVAWISGKMDLGGATRTFNVTAGTNSSAIEQNADLDLGGVVISGNGGITKTGNGILSLGDSNNTFTGMVTVLAGTLRAEYGFPALPNSSLGASSLSTAVQLGDPTGSNPVTFQWWSNNNGNAGSSFLRNLNVVAGTAPVTIQEIFGGTNGPLMSNTITLNRSVTFSMDLSGNGGGSSWNMSGPILNSSGANNNVTFTTVGQGVGYNATFTNPANNWSGTTTVLNGLWVFGNYSLANSAVILDKGITGATTLSFASNPSNSNQIASLNDGSNGGGILSNNSNGTPVLAIGTASGTTSFSGPIINPNGGGFVQIAKSGGSTQIYNNTTADTGIVFIDGGTWKQGTAGVMATAPFTIQAGGTLALDSSNHTTTGVTRGAAVNSGGSITLGGNTNNNTQDLLGAYTLRSGAANIAISAPAAVNGVITNLTLASFTRTGTEDGTIVFSGASLGSTGLAFANVGQVTVTAANPFGTITGLGTTAATIIPYAVGDTTPGGAGIGFVTYDSTNITGTGVRLLLGSEYNAGLAGNTNSQITGAGTSVVGTGISVNSLFLNGTGQSVTGGTFTVKTAGAILSIGGNGVNANTISATTLAFGGEAIIDTVNDLNITSPTITLGGAFTKTGAGTLSLGANLGNGTLTINNGTLMLNAPNIVNGATGAQVFLNKGGTLDVNGNNQILDRLAGFGQSTNDAAGASSSNGGIVTNNSATSNAIVSIGNSAGNNATFYGGIQDGTGSKTVALVKNGTNTQTFWTNNPAGYSFGGGTTINAGTLQYHVNTVSSYSLGSGAAGITLNGGNLEVDPEQFNGGLPSPQLVLNVNTITDYGLVNFSSPVTVTAAGGGFYGMSLGPTNLASNFTGNMLLGGALTINGTGTAGGNLTNRYQGATTLDQSAAGGLPGFVYQKPSGANYTSNLESVITDGAGAAVNPLALRGSTFTQFNVTGNSTYSHGTIVQGFVNLPAAGNILGTTPPITYAADAQLGTGNVYIQPGSKLKMNAADNVKTAGNAGSALITVSGSPLSQALLDNAFSFAGTQANLGIASASSGILAIDTATFTTNLNMSTLGNGKMFLGSLSAGTYGGSSLTASGDNTYRLGGGGGTLTIANSVLNGAGASLIVGEPAGVVSGGVGSVNTNFTNVPSGASASVVLSSSNTFDGNVTVNLGSKLTAQAPANSGSGFPAFPLFGSVTQPVNLNGGSLQVVGIALGSHTNLGAVTINGFGKLGVTASGAPVNVLTVDSLSITTSRPNHDVFIVDSSVNGTTSQLFVNNGLADSAGAALPGYFISSANTGANNQGNFLTYNAGSGFLPYANYVAANATWSNVDNSGAMVVNDPQASTLVASTPTSVYGLKMSATNGFLNLNGNTLNVGAGGIIFTFEDGGNPNGPQITGNVNFGANEGLIYTAVVGATWSTDRNPNISGNITGTNGLTISGPGIFQRLATSSGFTGITGAASGITGTITLHQSTLVLTGNQANGLGVGGNQNASFADYDNFALDGGAITQNNRFGMSLMGSLTLLPGGGVIESLSDAGGSVTEFIGLNGQISGSGVLTLQGDGGTAPHPFNIYNASNNYNGGTVINNAAGAIPNVNVNPASSLGTGDVVVNGTNLVLNGSVNIASTARLNLGAFATATFQGGSFGSPGTPIIGTLEGSGNVVLGKTGGIEDNLTVGGGNASTVFDGVISQGVGAFPSNFTKVGSGTLTLAGLNTYTGFTTVSAGQIQLLNGLSLQNTPVSVTPVNGLTFTQGLTVASLGALHGADNFALTDTNGTALALTIGGTNLGDVSTGGLTGGGSLTKAGTGTQGLGGTNAYSGPTTINGGTFRAMSATALNNTSSVTVATGANFDFASGTGGTLNVKGGNAPLTLANGSGIGAEIGGNIKVGVVTATGTVKLDVYGNAATAVTAPSGSFILVNATSGLTSGGASYTLGNIYNNTNFTLSAIPFATDSTVSVNATPQTALTTAFYKGTFAVNNVMALSDGNASSNWSATSGGAAQPLIPGPLTAVTISTGATNLLLGANMNVGPTTVSGTTALTLNYDGSSLTANGLTVTNTAATILNAPLTINGLVTANSTAAVTLNSTLAGSGGIYKIGTGTLTVGGTSTYSGPANVFGGTLVLGPGATTGTAVVRNNSTLQINAASSVPAAGSINLLAPPVLGGPAMLATGPDFAANQALLGALTGGSKGIIALGTDTANNLSFANLPNIFLGSTTAPAVANDLYGITYYGSSLTPNGATYRLGGGSGTLSIYNSVLVGASNSLVVGQPIPVGATLTINSPAGIVNLRAANTLNGGITINNGSTLIGLVQASGSAFGATNAVAINGGIMQLEGDPVRQLTNNAGAVAVQGAGSILINTVYGQSATTLNTSLIVASVARTNQGTLQVGAIGNANTFGGATTETSHLFDTNSSADLPLTTLNGGGTMMTTPFIFGTAGLSATNSGFMTYGANGLVPAVPSRLDTGAANALATALATDLVYVTGSDTSMSTANVAIQAMTVNGNFTVNSTGTAMLTISGGGLNMSPGGSGAITIGAATVAANTFTLSFANSEAIVANNTSNNGVTINAVVTNSATAGLTKTGVGSVTLANPANTFAGQVTINQGSLIVGTAESDTLGNASNGVFLNGGVLSVGSLSALSTATFTRTIAVGPVGGELNLNNNNGQNALALTVSSTITGTAGTGPLTLQINKGAAIISGTSNTYTGGTVIETTAGAAGSLTINSGATLGSGDVDVLGGTATTLNLLGDGNIPGTPVNGFSTARLNIDSGNTVNFKSLSPSIGSLEGAGSTTIGTTSVATNLTIGNNNLNTAFTGAITLGAGAPATAGITKIGTGQLTLAGASTYTGPTAVNVGVLNITGSLGNTAVTVAPNAMLAGNGSIAGAVTIQGVATLAPSAASLTTPAGHPLTISGAVLFTGNTFLQSATTASVFAVTLASATPGPNPSGYDQVVYGSNLVLNSTFSDNGAVLVVNDAAYIAGGHASTMDQFWILDGQPGSSAIDMSGTFPNNTFASVNTVIGTSGTTYSITYNAPGDPLGTAHDVLLQPTSVAPEPASLSLVALAAAGLLTRRRRRSV